MSSSTKKSSNTTEDTNNQPKRRASGAQKSPTPTLDNTAPLTPIEEKTSPAQPKEAKSATQEALRNDRVQNIVNGLNVSFGGQSSDPDDSFDLGDLQIDESDAVPDAASSEPETEMPGAESSEVVPEKGLATSVALSAVSNRDRGV